MIIICVLFLGVSTNAQKKKNTKVSIQVDGICLMCKKRIEKAALNTKGVKYAVWNPKTHLLSLIINERKTNVKTIQKNIVTAGHDTKTMKATEEAYNSIMQCCRYRDKKIIDSHKKGEQQ